MLHHPADSTLLELQEAAGRSLPAAIEFLIAGDKPALLQPDGDHDPPRVRQLREGVRLLDGLERRGYGRIDCHAASMVGLTTSTAAEPVTLTSHKRLSVAASKPDAAASLKAALNCTSLVPASHAPCNMPSGLWHHHVTQRTVCFVGA